MNWQHLGIVLWSSRSGQETNGDNVTSITVNQLTIILETTVIDTIKRYARSWCCTPRCYFMRTKTNSWNIPSRRERLVTHDNTKDKAFCLQLWQTDIKTYFLIIALKVIFKNIGFLWQPWFLYSKHVNNSYSLFIKHYFYHYPIVLYNAFKVSHQKIN